MFYWLVAIISNGFLKEKHGQNVIILSVKSWDGDDCLMYSVLFTILNI
jgi:hypothetical protein